jgi:hypothetical protein
MKPLTVVLISVAVISVGAALALWMLAKGMGY